MPSVVAFTMTVSQITLVRKYGPLFFAAGGAILVLWQMLLPGYVLTWDMVFGPSRAFPAFSGFINGVPLTLLMWGAGFVAPMWLVQKAVLIALFFSLFYLPIRFFPFSADIWTRFAASAFYAVNPFVYERFLAGQWGVLAAYALLAPLTYFLFELIREAKTRTAAYLAFIMLLIGVFSLHAFVMSVLIVSFVVASVALARGLALVKYAALAGVLVAAGSLYWIVPYLLNGESLPLRVFSEEHWSAFETSADPLLGASGNVLALYGFWGESYPWMQTLLLPKDVPLVFFPALAALLIIVVIGAFSLAREMGARPGALALLAIGALAFVFSVGVAPSVFESFNTWLFERVSFWSGFRDTQKWSMWLAVSYAYFFAAGASYLVAHLRSRLVYAARICLVLLPLTYTFTMPGFAGQLRAIEYPASWYEADAILATDEECKALFLPWHQYYPLAFNRGMLTVSPASRFFDCEIVSSQDAEIGEVGEQGNTDHIYLAISEAVAHNDPQSIDPTLDVLRSAGIRYIVFTDDLLEIDGFTYPFLDSPTLTVLYEKTVDNQALVILKL